MVRFGLAFDERERQKRKASLHPAIFFRILSQQHHEGVKLTGSKGLGAFSPRLNT